MTGNGRKLKRYEAGPRTKVDIKMLERRTEMFFSWYT